MKDYYVNYNCISGCCPIVLQEERYGGGIAYCEDYCGNKFDGCDYCYFEGSEMCKDCFYYNKSIS